MIPTCWRETAGFAIAPIVAGLTVSGWLSFAAARTDEFAGLLFWAAIVAYLAEFAIAIPVHMFLQRREISGCEAYAGLGALTGFAPFAVLNAIGFEFATWIWIATAAGIVSALLFWVLAVRREPAAPQSLFDDRVSTRSRPAIRR